MCLPGQPPGSAADPAAPPAATAAAPETAADAPPAAGVPVSAADAVAMAHAGLAYLATADMASLPAAVQAECLRGLERAESLHTAARAGALAAFMSCGGCEDDGQGSARAWLRWQTRITSGAAAGAVGWVRRLAAHPAVGEALAAGEISASWAREICAWTDRLPRRQRRRTPMRSCWPPRRAARNWRTWPGWRRRCAAAARRPDGDDRWRVRGPAAAAGPDAAGARAGWTGT